ncbi:hypothetical protein ACFY8S_01855 [Streptomyces hygroscopicus]|uniref:hypothetical protein n=1 Tax=Streptomyces hygroscopicus TaxID=1912 RepID=UPI0036AF600B
MAEVVLAGVLGAAVLAIVLLYKNGQRQADRLTKLEAELAAEKIARITQQPVPLPATAEEEEPEPAYRKRHLALYIGGGVAALFTSLGPRLRDLVRRHRTAAVTAAASSVLVATSAVAYYANAGSDATPDSTSPSPAATAPDINGSHDQAPEAGAHDKDRADDKTGTTHDDADTGSRVEPAFVDQTGVTDDETTGASQPGEGDEGEQGDQERPGSGALPAQSTPTPTAPAEPQPPTSEPPTTEPPTTEPPTTEPPTTEPPTTEPPTTEPPTTEPPTTEPPTTEPPTTEPPTTEPPGDCGLCLCIPPFLELCLSGKAS